MAHFAKLDSNQIVTQVVVVNNNELLDENGVEQEERGIAFLQGLHGDDTVWRQTSYNARFRLQYAAIGSHYCSENDSFSEPKPYDSWTIDETNNWQPPIPKPEDIVNEEPPHIAYVWNEELYQSDPEQGWQGVEVNSIITIGQPHD